MRKNLKGFTLIECLVALAILGIASVVMAEIYANVSRINRSNHYVNTSLANQMKLVEEATGADSYATYYGGTAAADSNASSTNRYPPHKQGIVSTDTTHPNVSFSSSYSSWTYSYSVDVYQLYSRDTSDNPSSSSLYEGLDEKDVNLRYKYILGHSN